VQPTFRLPLRPAQSGTEFLPPLVLSLPSQSLRRRSSRDPRACARRVGLTFLQDASAASFSHHPPLCALWPTSPRSLPLSPPTSSAFPEMNAAIQFCYVCKTPIRRPFNIAGKIRIAMAPFDLNFWISDFGYVLCGLAPDIYFCNGGTHVNAAISKVNVGY